MIPDFQSNPPSSSYPLDGPPPSPQAMNAQEPSEGMDGLAPAVGAESVGGLQTVQLTLQTAQAVAQGLDVLGQMNPSLAGLVGHLQLLLKEGVRKALQQGPLGSEASTFGSLTRMM